MRHIVALLILLAGCSSGSMAQTLSAPSRSIFKCTVDGKTSYSDSPCIGAERLEIEPSRGVGKTAGRDVQRERQREMIAEAIRPLSGMDSRQFEVHERRLKIPADAQRECKRLDVQIPEAEHAEQRAAGEQRELQKVVLFNLRQRQRALRC